MPTGGHGAERASCAGPPDTTAVPCARSYVEWTLKDGSCKLLGIPCNERAGDQFEKVR